MNFIFWAQISNDLLKNQNLNIHNSYLLPEDLAELFPGTSDKSRIDSVLSIDFSQIFN